MSVPQVYVTTEANIYFTAMYTILRIEFTHFPQFRHSSFQKKGKFQITFTFSLSKKFHFPFTKWLDARLLSLFTCTHAKLEAFGWWKMDAIQVLCVSNHSTWNLEHSDEFSMASSAYDLQILLEALCKMLIYSGQHLDVSINFFSLSFSFYEFF